MRGIMPVNLEDRPLRKIREEIIDQLVMNYGHEEITLEAFEKRLDKAMETEDRETLLGLVADLELKIDNQYQQTKAKKLANDKNYFNTDSAENMGEQEKILRVLSSIKRSGAWVVSKNINATSILSDFSLDFTDAIFEHPVVTIKIFSLLTSDTLFLPEGVRVICNTSSILGSVNNKVVGKYQEGAPTIIIEGISILSSLDITVRVTMKEKWLRFADGVKKLFN